ncbi:hypothetical protein CCAJJPOJ_03411 [Lelliottia sp. T2.26D-8]|nr:hypothetical protein CCAJJPOJ_03411 [Lelliottia sp. T2.26D-8]
MGKAVSFLRSDALTPALSHGEKEQKPHRALPLSHAERKTKPYRAIPLSRGEKAV